MSRSEHIDKDPNAPVIILFGGSPYRRDEVISLIESIGGISIYGTLNLEEGMRKIKSLEKVDIVLIGGRYTDDQRVVIKEYVKNNSPKTKITQPGIDYPYANESIKKDKKIKLGL